MNKTVTPSQQRFVNVVACVWKVVNNLTGFKLGIIPRVRLGPERKIEHWINLNRDVIPFAYMTSSDSGTEEMNVSLLGSNDINAKTSTAALLITEYVNGVLTRLGKEAGNPLIHINEMLNELYTCLHKLKTDMESIILSSESHNLLITMSKINELSLKIEQLSLTEAVVSCDCKDTMLTVTESQLLCSSLGLVPKFTDKMIEIRDEVDLHQSPFYIVNNLIDEEQTMNVANNCNQSDRNLTSALSQIGFSEEKSKEIADDISNHPGVKHSPISWAKKYLVKTFKKHPLLKMMTYVENYSNKPINDWFDAEADLLAKRNENSIKLRFKMIQLDTVGNVSSETIHRKFHQNEHTLLFHAAKEASSLDSILRKGILLNCGHLCQDFSHGNGFYLSDDFEVALDWANKRKPRPTAVIVYRVSNHLLKIGKYGGLDLTYNEELWFKVVDYHRNGCFRTKDLDVINLSRHSFIKGLVSKNGFKLRIEFNVSLVPFEFRGKYIRQYCIRSEELAVDLSSCVAAVIIQR